MAIATAASTADRRASDPVAGVLVDDENVITPPVADPIALGTASVIPPATVAEPVEEPDITRGESRGEIIMGVVVPNPRNIDGKTQNNIEVLTGKRIQLPEDALFPPAATQLPAKPVRKAGESDDDFKKREDDYTRRKEAAQLPAKPVRKAGESDDDFKKREDDYRKRREADREARERDEAESKPAPKR
jgi:hypothetical protein